MQPSEISDCRRTLRESLSGEATDGHGFVANALARGAAAAVVSRDVPGAKGPLVRVPDTMTVLVLISMLGSTHSSIMTGARVTYQQSRDGLLFAWLGTVHPLYKTPAVGLWVQCALSCTAVLTLKTFKDLSNTFTFTMWIFYGLAGAVIFILRCKRPDAVRPFRCIGYPVVPAIFVASAIFMTVLAIKEDPATTLKWVAVLAAGFPVYVVWNHLIQRGSAHKQSDPR